MNTDFDRASTEILNNFPGTIDEFIFPESSLDIDKTNWYQKPLTILQTNIRETDARNYDANSVVKYMLDTACNALIINAGGIVDFFKNPLPAAMVNKFMGDRDILKEISTACKKAGIRVIARIDFRGAEEEIYNKFPDWFMLNANKQPVITNYVHKDRVLKLHAGCYLGKHRNEYLKEMVNHIMSNYEVDGIWHNAPGYNGICYCDRCTHSYKEASGKELPVDKISSPDELDQYMKWKVTIADEHMNGIKKLIKTFGNDKVYCAEIFSMYAVENRVNSGIDLNNARNHFDFLVSVAFGDNGDPDRFFQSLNYASTITKFLKAMVPEREAIILCGGNGTLHRLVSDPKVDYKIWLWQVLSAGGRYWDNYFTDLPKAAHDRRNIYDHTEVFQFVKKHERILERHAPVGNIGIYYSRPSRLSYREKHEEGDRFGTEIRGMEMVMMENHIPHNFLLDDQITLENLRKFKLILLPNVRCMSDHEIEVIQQWVKEGGKLIATYSTSLYDEEGRERINFGLNEVFGVDYKGKKENTRRDNYQYILNKEHPLVKEDSSQTELLFNAGYTALTSPKTGANVICTWVPTIQNQPPDKAWVEKFSTEFPTVVENNYGKGKVIYFSNQPDLLGYEIGHPDMCNLLLRSIRYLMGEAIPIKTNAPPSVNIGLTESLIRKGEYILSLVNTTSGPVRPVRELIPVEDIKITVRLDGKSLKNFTVLRAQGGCKITSKGQEIEIDVKLLQDYCSVFLEMAI